jgi:hypothetical protein
MVADHQRVGDQGRVNRGIRSGNDRLFKFARTSTRLGRGQPDGVTQYTVPDARARPSRWSGSSGSCHPSATSYSLAIGNQNEML